MEYNSGRRHNVVWRGGAPSDSVRSSSLCTNFGSSRSWLYSQRQIIFRLQVIYHLDGRVSSEQCLRLHQLCYLLGSETQPIALHSMFERPEGFGNYFARGGFAERILADLKKFCYEPSGWVQLILKDNLRTSKQLEQIAPLPAIRILDHSDARHYKERSVVLTSYSLSSSMDEHALQSGYISPSSSTRRRAQAPTPRQHSSTRSLPPLPRGDFGSPRHSESSRSRAHPSHPYPVHRAYTHPEPSPSPVPSSSSSGLAQPRAHGQTEGTAPQPMRYSFTHPGGWPDRLQRARTSGPVAHAQASRSSSHLASGPSQPRRGKRKRPMGPESGISAPQPVAAHRDTGGPQRSHRRHYNIAEKTQSTMLPSGGMYMTFPLDIPSPEPDTESRAGPPPFEHGPTELPPRPYEGNPQEAEREGSGPERPAKRGRLPADVMDHLPTIEGRLHKIEVAVKEYIDLRNERAMEKSKLPGS